MKNTCICDSCGKQEKSAYMTIPPSGWFEIRGDLVKDYQDFCSIECLAEWATAQLTKDEQA